MPEAVHPYRLSQSAICIMHKHGKNCKRPQMKFRALEK